MPKPSKQASAKPVPTHQPSVKSLDAAPKAGPGDPAANGAPEAQTAAENQPANSRPQVIEEDLIMVDRKPSEIPRAVQKRLLGNLADEEESFGDLGRLLAPLIKVAATSAPYAKPVANAIISIVEGVEGALIQMNNCERLGEIIELVPEALLELSEAGLLGR